MNFIFSKKLKDYLSIVFIGVSLCFSITIFYTQICIIKKEFSAYFRKNLDEKYVIIDKDFYKFISFCKKKIPIGSEVLFYNSWEFCKKAYFPRGYIIFGYEREKARFYLYPIKVFTLPYEDKIIEKQELYFYDKEEILKRVSFIIVNSLDTDFPGFKIKYTYGSDRYIFIRE